MTPMNCYLLSKFLLIHQAPGHFRNLNKWQALVDLRIIKELKVHFSWSDFKKGKLCPTLWRENVSLRLSLLVSLLYGVRYEYLTGDINITVMNRHTSMMTPSNGNIFQVTGHLCGEFTGPGEFPTKRPVTRSFDVFFDLRLNKRLSKEWWGWWFETLSRPLWLHRNAGDALCAS